MSGWGRALMSMLGDQKAERTERDSLIERYGGKAGQEGVPSAPIYGQIGGDYGSMEGPYDGTGEGVATDEMKAQAKSAKAFRDLGEHLYGYSREELSTKSLGELRGLARKEESAIVQQEKTQARQDRLAQFAEVQKHQADMLGVSRQGMALEGMRTLGGLYNQYRDDTRADAQAKLAAQIHADTVARFGRVEAERGADRNAYRSMLQFGQPMQPGEEGPMPSMQFNAARAMQQTGGNIQPEDIAALEKMGRPGYYPSIVPLPGGGSALMTSPNSAMPWDRLPGAVADKALPPVVMTVPGATPGSSTRVPMTAEQYTAYQAANPPPAELKKRGDRAALEEELRQHETALKTGNDDRYGFGNAYSRQNRVVELKRKLAELGAGPAPAASSPGRGQAIRYKLVNGQLVSE